MDVNLVAGAPCWTVARSTWNRGCCHRDVQFAADGFRSVICGKKSRHVGLQLFFRAILEGWFL